MGNSPSFNKMVGTEGGIDYFLLGSTSVGKRLFKIGLKLVDVKQGPSELVLLGRLRLAPEPGKQIDNSEFVKTNFGGIDWYKMDATRLSTIIFLGFKGSIYTAKSDMIKKIKTNKVRDYIKGLIGQLGNFTPEADSEQALDAFFGLAIERVNVMVKAGDQSATGLATIAEVTLAKDPTAWAKIKLAQYNAMEGLAPNTGMEDITKPEEDIPEGGGEAVPHTPTGTPLSLIEGGKSDEEDQPPSE